MKTLILASQSPRRTEILKNAKYHFVTFPVYVSEIPDKNLSLDEQIIDIARRKGLACLDQYTHKHPTEVQNCVIVCADTLVCLDEEPIGKPEDEEDAIQILKRLSGRDHQVKTAVVVIECDSKKITSHIETTDIAFKELTEKEILDYVKTGEPMDKAGAYGIQGLAKNFVQKIKGDYNNVVGLPLEAFEQMIQKLNINLQKTSKH